MRPTWADWEAPVRDLADRVRRAVSAAQDEARERGTTAALARPVGRGAGDVTFGLDAAGERAVDAWLAERAAGGPLSLLTEDAGWRHVGPGGALLGPDHGGPRLVIDPIDGTRNLMAGLRSAWTAIAFAPPGAAEPRLADVQAGVVAELPTPRAAVRSIVSAHAGGGARIEEVEVATDRQISSRALVADADDRVDHGYLPVFRYKPELRPAIARVEAELFRLLAERESCDTRAVYDDQYICNAGQLVLLAQGVYRAVFDPRALVAARLGTTTVTTKPYDVAGAVICAREAGAIVTAADGAELDFPLDARTPVGFAGYANAATRRRVEPCWLAALGAI
jgi:fructose-1,6-bisphosphatase/inositol monophosphatase family enzyme